MTFLLHSSVFLCAVAGFAWSSIHLHIAGPQHKEIYLFDYCPAHRHVLLIDCYCVPSAAGLLVSLAQNSLKDSSVETLVTLFHRFCLSSLSRSQTPPSISCSHLLLWNFVCLLHFSHVVFLDANVASDLRQFNLGSGRVLECICVHYA